MTDTVKKSLKEKFIEEIDSAADHFLDDFQRVCDNSGGVPALSGIEEAAELLDERAKEAYSSLIHQAIETIDEETIVESKKASLKERG